LSTVYGIVKQSGGSIWVNSEVGCGTTFRIYLPRVDDPVVVEGEPVESESESGTETILVVEDDQPVRKLICETLRGTGYRVIEAANGDAAVRVCQEHQGPIPLMITDLVMPQMSGRELADRLVQLRPHMQVLFISGYTDDAAVRHGLLKSAAAFLEKPFSPGALARKVRSILDRQVESHVL
jgi:CheY-like chemotaxis protein